MMPVRCAMILALAFAGLCAAPAAAQENVSVPAAPSLPPPPEELVLEGDNIITVTLNNVPLRLEVSAEAFGPPVINPEVAISLAMVPEFRRGWRFGPVVVDGAGANAMIDFGAGAVMQPVTWSNRPVSDKADGRIGVHHLPHDRVTFALRPGADAETVQRFAIARAGGRSNTRLGTEVAVGKQRLMMIFTPERAENLITAPTANFIATHQEGGFEPDSDGMALMDFGVARPIRMMRIALPVLLGELAVERFAVRIEDYGDPRRVGEIGANDPRFQPGQILVSRRKGRGRPDLLTRIGRDQIAHCSRLTYDLASEEIRLFCGAPPD